MSSKLTTRIVKHWLIAVVVVGALADVCSGQQIQMGTSGGPHYVDVPMQLQVAVAGFDEKPQPDCTLQGEVPAGLKIDLIGVTPQYSRQIFQRNGRVTSSQTVTFRYNYRVTASKAGTYEIGPFVVKQGDTEVRSRVADLRFGVIETDGNMRVGIELPEQPVYQGQRVPVKVWWAYAGNMRQIRNLRVYSPLFDQFEFEDEEARGRENALPIQTSDGQLELAAEANRETIDGKQFVSLTANRTLLANEVGTFEMPAVTASVLKLTGRARRSSLFDDFFEGFGSQRQGVPVRAKGKPLQLTVKPLPTQDRPESFSGAVGKGYSIDVQANRTVVRVGDPITLAITLRGDGNLANTGLPQLSADGGMSAAQFRLPSELPTGVYDQGEKQFNVTVRVDDESVNEIPALAFSWFDPSRETYLTTRSKPVAVRVGAAQVVSSADVVSGGTQDESTAAPQTNSDSFANKSPDVSGRFALSNADLSIETDVDRLLLRPSGGWFANTIPWMLYALGIGAIAVTVLDRRRRQVDPEIRRRRTMFAEQKAKIQSASSLPTAEAAEQVATALRQVLPDASPSDRREAESILSRLEAFIYAPSGQTTGRLDAELVDSAASVVQRIGQAS